MDAIPIRPKIPMMIRYSATMVLSSRGMTRMRIPAIKDTNGPMLILSDMRGSFCEWKNRYLAPAQSPGGIKR